MRIAIVLSFLVVGCAAQGSTVYRHEVDRGSDLEKELGYTLSIQGPASEYVVKFHATAAGKLKELFELDLTVTDTNGMLVQLPLAIRSKSNKEDEFAAQFLVKKELISQAVLALRCAPWMSMHPETSYAIRLGDYAPGYKPTETQRIAELRKRHSALGLLASHRSRNPPDYSSSLTGLTVAQKLFPEVNFVGLSRAGLEMLLGPPDPEPSSPPNSVTYTFGYRGQFVIRQFHFDSKGDVESVEKINTQ